MKIILNIKKFFKERFTKHRFFKHFGSRDKSEPATEEDTCVAEALEALIYAKEKQAQASAEGKDVRRAGVLIEDAEERFAAGDCVAVLAFVDEAMAIIESA